jgi:PAS domain S-box-containing protein
MHALSFIHLAAFIVDISLIVIVLSRNYKAQLNRLCAYVATSFACWSFGYCIANVAADFNTAMFWVNVGSIGWITFPLTTLYFYLALAGKDNLLKNKFLFVALLLITGFFLYQQWTGNLASDVVLRSYGWVGVWSGTLYCYLLFAYFSCAIALVFYLILNYRHGVTSKREITQARLMFSTTAVATALAITSDIILPELNIPLIPQLADVFMVIWAVGIVICITRYGLMSITPAMAAEQIFDTTTDMLFLLETDGKIKHYNPASLELLGYDKKELFRSHFSNIIADKEATEALLEETVQKSKSVSRELDFRVKNNVIISGLVSASVIMDRTKKVIGFVISAKDVTERKRMENALQQSEEKFSIAFRSSPQMIIITDIENDRYLEVNENFANAIGYTREEIMSRSVSSFADMWVKPEEFEEFVNTLNSKGKVRDWEFTFRIKSGELRDWICSAEIVTISGNRCILAVADDITEHKRMEETLRISEETIRKHKELTDRVLDNTPNAVLVINENEIIELTNRAFYQIFQRQEGEVVGKPVNNVIPVNELLQAISRVISNQESKIRSEFKFDLNGQKKIIIMQIMRTQQDEIMIIMNDVTEIRNRQENLYLTDRLASIGEMASGIAHEINNPLTGIIGLSSLLNEREIPADVAEDLAAINSEAQRCAAIVKNLLSFARKHTPERQPLNVADILADVIELRSYYHKKNNISVEIDFSADISQILADYYQLQQVFVNIIINAEAAMLEAHQRGNLKITGESVNGSVRVSITDDGPGISEENMKRIFDPFFTTKEVGKGTGLGLSICYGIVTSHGGRIYANSEPGQGTTFVVELPAYKPGLDNLPAPDKQA